MANTSQYQNCIENDTELRDGSSRAIERSRSYSEAIKNSTVNDDIVNLIDSKVYLNDDTRGKFAFSHTFVKENETSLFNNNNIEDTSKEKLTYLYAPEDTDDEQINGLVMKIDVDNHERLATNSSDMHMTSPNPINRPFIVTDDNDFNMIEIEESIYNNTTSIPDTSSEYHSFPLRSRSTRSTSTRHESRSKHNGARRQKSRRAVMKDGEENVPLRQHIPRKSIKYLRDAVNTIINSKWRFIFCLIVVSHFMFWLFFALIWYTVTLSYQDDYGDGKEHCVTGTSSFAGMLMMAVETQMTIGYGVRYPNEECFEAIFVLVFEIVAGTALSGGLSSMLFVKLVRPQKHISSVGFSRKAAVCMRDGQLCLTIRVWDLMSLHTINSHVTAYLLKPIRTLEGEYVQNYIYQLKLNNAKSFMLWPITVVHVIDQDSPLFMLSAQDMMNVRFEIVVCLAGASQSMGTVTQSKTSYLSREVIWGFRFKNVMKYSKNNEAYTIETDNLNTVEQVDTPLCSAYQLMKAQKDLNSPGLPASPTAQSFRQDRVFEKGSIISNEYAQQTYSR